MYCSKCGRKIKDDSIYCNFCGNKIDEIKDVPTIAEKDVKIDKEKNINLKKIFLIVLLLLTLIGVGVTTTKKVIKNNTVNEVPNYYLSFGSLSQSSDENGKTFSVDVTSEVPLFELSIDVYIYYNDELISNFNYTTEIDMGLSTKRVHIPFENEELINFKYDFLFYGTGKTHEELPDLDYATITFLNHDGSVCEKLIVEKDYGDAWYAPYPTRNGYTFAGWYYDKKCSKKFDIGEQYYRDKGENLVLYSKWIKN